jgi:hypothetical protein
MQSDVDMQEAHEHLRHQARVAEAAALEAQQAAQREASRASELQVRCLSAESRAAELLTELDAAHCAAGGLQERLDDAVAAALGGAERRAVHAALLAMLSGCGRCTPSRRPAVGCTHLCTPLLSH